MGVVPAGKCQGEFQWIHRRFEQFSKGSFDNGGDNLYVNAKGIIEMIHRFDVNNDGYVDIVLPNAHGYIERGLRGSTPRQRGKARTGPDTSFPTTVVG